jgi:hypothetical protein
MPSFVVETLIGNSISSRQKLLSEDLLSMIRLLAFLADKNTCWKL